MWNIQLHHFRNNYKCVRLVAYFALDRKTLGMYIQRVERTSTKREQSAHVVCKLRLCRGPIPHYTARIRLACRRIIRFTGVRRALWDSLVCHGNPETAVPLAVRFSRCSSSVLTRTLLRPRQQRSRVRYGKQGIAHTHTHIYAHIRTRARENISASQRKEKRCYNATPRTIISNTIRYMYRQFAYIGKLRYRCGVAAV